MIQVTFLDGTAFIMTSDTIWRVIKTILDGFSSPSFDDSEWAAATAVSKYEESLWAGVVVVPMGALPPTILSHTAPQMASHTTPTSIPPTTTEATS